MSGKRKKDYEAVLFSISLITFQIKMKTEADKISMKAKLFSKNRHCGD
jgi:hypothetical protein